MTEEEQNYQDHVQISGLMAMVGANVHRPRKFSAPKSRWGLFWMRLIRRVRTRLVQFTRWVILSTLRRKMVERGQSRLRQLAGVNNLNTSFPCQVEKVGSIEYPGRTWQIESRRSAVAKHRLGSVIPKPDVE